LTANFSLCPEKWVYGTPSLNCGCTGTTNYAYDGICLKYEEEECSLGPGPLLRGSSPPFIGL